MSQFKYEHIEPVTYQCEISKYNGDKYKRIGLWENKNDFKNDEEPNRVLTINHFLNEIDKNNVEFYEEHAFEGNITEVDATKDYVEVIVENEYCKMVHIFDVTIDQAEKFSKGDPSTSTPGSKGIYDVYELSTNADVEIIQPDIEPKIFEYESDYYKNVAEDDLEKHL